MYTLKPLPPPGPPQSGRSLGIPLAVNTALLVGLNVLSNSVRESAELVLFLVFFQLFNNCLLMAGAFISDEPRWGAGFLLSGLLVLLVGVGMCGRRL